jgi:UPF0755 protein
MVKKKLMLRGGLIGAALVILLVIAGGGILYSRIASPNLVNVPQDSVYFFVKTGSEYPQIYIDFKKSGWLRHEKGFDWVAKRKGYPELVKPGRYLLTRGMSNSDIVNLLRSGRQSELNLVFNTTRHFDRLAGVISKQIEADSASLIAAFRDTSVMASYGFTPVNWTAMFIPNTYRFFWNTGVNQFLDRMKREYDSFWNETRMRRLKEIGMDRIEVVTLASIVQEETFKADEMPRVAGAYMNRLRKGIRLQADPTVIYAWQDYTIRRVLHRHLLIDSPYNTYKYAGIPPGPIRIPSVQAIDACLNYEKHDYIYFCAKEDFSGYHSFARTYSEHLVNARRYQRAITKAKG